MSPQLSSKRSSDAASADEETAGPRVGRIAAGFAVFVAATFGAVYLAAPWAVERMILSALADIGFPKATLRVTDLGVTEIKLADLSLGPDAGVAARRVIVDYSPARLAKGGIDGIELEAPTLPVAVRAGGVDFGVLAPLLESSGSGGGVRIVGPVRVREGLLEVTTPFGTVEAKLDGEVLFTDGLGTKIQAAVDLTHPDARLRARINGQLDDGGEIAVDVVVDDAASTAALAFSQMTGTLHIGGAPPTTLDGAGTLAMRGVGVGGVAIGNLDVSGTVTDTKAAVDLVLGGDGTGLSVHATVLADNVLDPAANVRIDGDAATDGLKGPAGLPGALDAVGMVDFALSGARRDLQALMAVLGGEAATLTQPVRGRIGAEQLSVSLPDGAFDLTLNGTLDADVSGAGWTLTAPSPLALEAGSLVGGVRHTVSTALVPVAGRGVLQGGLDRARPIEAAVRVDGRIDGRYPLAGGVDGKLWLDAAKGLLIEDLALTLDTKPISVGKLDLSVETASVHLSGVPGDLTLDVVAAAGVNGPVGGLRVVGGRVDLQTRVDFAEDAIRAYPPGCIDLRAATLRHDDFVVRPQPVKLCPPADGGPMLIARLDGGALKRIETTAVLGSAEVVAEGLVAYPLAGTLPRVEATATYDPARDTWWLRFAAAGGALRVEGPDLALADIAAKGEVSGQGARIVGARLPSLGVKIVDHRRPLRLTPVEIAGKADVAGQGAQFDGTLTAPGGLKGTLTAAHRFDNGRGYAALSVPGWRFDGGAQPTQAAPILRGVVTDVTGALAADARIDWTEARTSSSARLALDNLSFATSAAQFAGVSGEIKLIDLLKPTSDGVQTVTFALVDPGVPLTNGEATFSLPGDGTLHLYKLGWPFAGGSIGLADATVPLDALPKSMTVDIVGLDAASLVRMTEVQDLAAEGMLGGRVPIVFGADGPAIDGARLKSVGGGSIRYRAQAAADALKQSGGSAELVAQALENFRFTDIEMTLDGPLDGEIKARAEIKGANPDLYDGKRIELNVNLSGVLRDLLRSATVFQELPASIRDRVHGPAGSRPEIR